MASLITWMDCCMTPNGSLCSWAVRCDSRERPALKVESSLVAQRSGADPADDWESIPDVHVGRG